MAETLRFTIDFFPQTDGHAIPGHISAQLPDGQIIHIKRQQRSVGRIIAWDRCHRLLRNTYAGDKPFSSDICLDYFTQGNVRPAGWEQRIAGTQSKNSDIDFLIACGMPVSDPPQNQVV